MTLANIIGLRCRARRHLRTHAGVVEAFSEGAIISEIDSLGRRLIEVQWDNEICVYVFPHEIEILDGIHPFGGDSEDVTEQPHLLSSSLTDEVIKRKFTLC